VDGQPAFKPTALTQQNPVQLTRTKSFLAKDIVGERGKMDQLIYGTSSAICHALTGAGLNELAYTIGFKGVLVFSGAPTVFCGPQESSYQVGLIAWGVALFVVASAVSALIKNAPSKQQPPTP
jgi:hypothetical protein